jgi:hypothetical protein
MSCCLEIPGGAASAECGTKSAVKEDIFSSRIPSRSSVKKKRKKKHGSQYLHILQSVHRTISELKISREGGPECFRFLYFIHTRLWELSEENYNQINS